MKLGLHQATLAGLGAVACGLAIAQAQSMDPQKSLMSEEVFKNVQVLKGIPVNQFMDTTAPAAMWQKASRT